MKVKRKKLKRHSFKRLKDESLFKVTQLDYTNNDYENIDLSARPDLNTSGVSSILSNETQVDTFDFDFLPPKRDFFLYTIAEHEHLTKKTFSYKKRNKNLNITTTLSKSDSNIARKT